MCELLQILSLQPQAISLVSSFASSVAAIGSLVVAIKVHRYGANATKHHTISEIRKLVVDIEAHTRRIEYLAPQLILARETLAAFSGAVGGSRQVLLKQEVKSMITEALSLMAQALTDNEMLTSSTIRMTADQLDNLVALMWKRLQTLRVISEELSDDCARIQQQNLRHYEQKLRINGLP
jgi:hypothetical protein